MSFTSISICCTIQSDFGAHDYRLFSFVSSTNLSEAIIDSFLALDVGQLIKDDYFTLFESVAALEVRLSDRPMISITANDSSDHGP